MRRPTGRAHLLYPGLVFASLVLFCVPDTQVQSLRGYALSFLRPILELTHASRGRIEPQVASIAVNLSETAPPEAENQSERIDRLQSDVVGLLNQLNHQRSYSALSTQHSALLNPPGVEADVIARQVLWQQPFLGLDRGSADGVRLNAGVLHRGAVVGRIVAVGAHAASMALVTHRGLCIGARLVNSRVEGVLQGAPDAGGERLCRLAVVSRETPAKVGEPVVTSGLDGTFPAGLWLGEVAALKKITDAQWEVSVRPACNENAVESVLVLTNALPEVPWPAAVGRKQKAEGSRQ